MSNVSGIAVLRDIKLRVKPGEYYVEIKAPDFRNITPAEVRKQISFGGYAGCICRSRDALL
jgi:hypothetical protein